MSITEIPASRETTGGLSYIEHLFALSEKDICSNPNRAVLRAIDEPQKTVLYIRPVCKTWACPECGKRNKRFWTARAIYGHEKLAESGDTLYFWTITAHEDVRDFDDGLYYWRKGWNALYCQLKRIIPKFAYVRIFEHHKDGAFHVHFITNGVPPNERWIKDAPRAKHMGYMNEAEEVRSKYKSGFYIAKYANKSIANAAWPRSVKRIQPSHSWPKLPENAPESPYKWKFVEFGTDLDREMRTWRKRGYGVQTF